MACVGTPNVRRLFAFLGRHIFNHRKIHIGKKAAQILLKCAAFLPLCTQSFFVDIGYIFFKRLAILTKNIKKISKIFVFHK